MSYYNVETDDAAWARVKVKTLTPARRQVLLEELLDCCVSGSFQKAFNEKEIRLARAFHGERCEARLRQNGMSKADH